MRRTALAPLAPLALAGSLMGCDIPMGPGNWESSGPACGWFCVDFALVAYAGQSFLKGDTLNVDVLSTAGFDYATWSVSGPSLALVDGDSVAPSVTRPTSHIRVLGLATGDAALYAQAAGSSLKDTLQLRIVDSSKVTKVVISSYPTPTIKVGEDWHLAVQLSDSVSLIAGYATGFSIGDTTVLGRSPAGLPWIQGRGIFLRGLAPGTAEITVSFRNLRSNLIRFTVIP